MGSSNSIQKISYEDIQFAQQQSNDYLIINTLPDNNQGCLILNSVNCNNEVETINSLLNENKSKKIIIYGKNCNDETIYNKIGQLFDLGFTRVLLYPGGLFEWLLLQDIYGNELFPTTSNELDIIKYKPYKKFNIKSLDY